MESTFASRVKQFRQHKGLSQQAFAEQCDLAQGNIAHMENGTEPKQSNVSKLTAGFPDLNPDWLLNGSGPMLRDGRTLTAVPIDQLPPAVPSEAKPQREGFPATPGTATPQEADFVGKVIRDLEQQIADYKAREEWYQDMLKKPLASAYAAAPEAPSIEIRRWYNTAAQAPVEAVVRRMYPAPVKEAA